MMALIAAMLYGSPPTNGAQWWSTNPNLTCASAHSLIYEIQLDSGGKGYACGVTGTFVWYAAGGLWGTSLRVVAPASGAIGVQYLFYDGEGNRISLDTIAAGSGAASGNTLGLALAANPRLPGIQGRQQIRTCLSKGLAWRRRSGATCARVPGTAIRYATARSKQAPTARGTAVTAVVLLFDHA